MEDTLRGLHTHPELNRNQVDATCYYFVDEAGDDTIFAGKGMVVVGSPGCSRFFALGVAQIPDPVSLGSELDRLRQKLLLDPYLRDMPSMQMDEHKSALVFHAKDDAPEVRREVFALLRQHPEIRFQAEVKDKLAVVDYIRQRQEIEQGYHYRPNELYDHMVRRLFKNLLHKNDRYVIYFARRGNSLRTEALRSALDGARKQFEMQWRIRNDVQLDIIAMSPPACPGLQVVDYLLWAVQRAFERHEDRYIRYIWDLCALVHDIDDTRERGYGVYYNRRKPLTRQEITQRQRI